MTPDQLFARPGPILLDGATGTELERRGFALSGAGWSARAIEAAPDLLAAIHRDYVDAGADIVTANTFRLHVRNLTDWGREADQAKLVERAVELARSAAGSRALVAASLAPIGDCYSPREVPQLESLRDEHAVLAGCLANAGAEFVLIETMVAVREAVAACRAVSETGLPFCVSFVSGPNATLLSGESLADGVRGVLPFRPLAVGVNCVSVRDVPAAIDVLVATAGSTATMVYANTGERAEDGSWRVTTASQPAVYAVSAVGWIDRGIRVIGGCCGTTPAHIAAMKVLNS